MATLTKDQRDALPETDFGDNASRLFPVVDQADLDAAARLVGKAKNPAGVKRRLVEIAHRKGLKPPDAWTAEFSAAEERAKTLADVQFDLGSDATEDGDHVVRHAPILFRAGDYPDKQFCMSPEELALAVEEAKEPVPLKLEHKNTVLDGKLGTFALSTLSDDFQTAGGKARMPKWLHSVLGTGPVKLSASWDRATKKLRDVSLVLHPRIDDAALMAAFAEADKKPKEEDKPTGMQAVHDLAVKHGAACGKADMSKAPPAFQAMHDAACAAGAKCQEATFTDPEKAKLKADLEAANKRAADIRRTAIDEAAAAFAESEVLALRAMPADKPGLTAEFVQASLDDDKEPAQFGRSRVQALRDRQARVKPHGFTRELVGVQVLGSGAPATEEQHAVAQAEKFAEAFNKRNGRK